jgi:hypothetical protein
MMAGGGDLPITFSSAARFAVKIAYLIGERKLRGELLEVPLNHGFLLVKCFQIPKNLTTKFGGRRSLY